MRIPRSQSRAIAIALWALAALSLPPADCRGAEKTEKNVSGTGTFVSFREGTLTLRSRSGLLVYDNVDAGYKTYQNNEDGPGIRAVDTVDALSGQKLEGNVASLSRVLPGAVVRVNVEDREIVFGLDYRVVGTLTSYRDGRLELAPAEAPPGFLKRPDRNVVLTVDRSVPVLESVDGADLRYAGDVGDVLERVKPGTMVTVRSEYDPDVVEVVEIGRPKRRIERYIGQSRGTVRGTLVSFRNGLIRLQGKGVNALAANEYDRIVLLRIPDGVPIVESIDGGPYEPADIEALKSAREGTTVTVRKVEEIVLEVRIGLARQP